MVAKMLIEERLARDRLRTRLADAEEARLARRAAAISKARRRARRAAERLHRAEQAVVRLRGSLHAEP